MAKLSLWIVCYAHFFEIIFYYGKIYITQICHFKVYTSVALIVFTMCIIIATVLKLFHHPKQKLCPLGNNFSFCSLQPLVTSNLLFVCINLCIKSKIFYVSGIIQHPSIFVWPFFFTEHNVFKFHPYYSMCLPSFLCTSDTPCTAFTNFCLSFISWWTLGWLLPSGYCEKGAAFIFEMEKAEIDEKKRKIITDRLQELYLLNHIQLN